MLQAFVSLKPQQPARTENGMTSFFEALENAKISVMYAVAFQYEHREDLNQNDLNLSLRALLFGERKVEF